jgi:MYXO-CTERM domain-containing protein
MRLTLRPLPVCSAVTTLWMALATASGAPTAVANPTPGPSAIFGGQEVTTCAWPTAVAVTGGNSLCTGTLVHPRIVMFAAHCGGGKGKKIVFGEDVGSPKKTLTPDLCLTNPDYGGVNDQEADWAFCRLTEAVTDLPVTPVVYGCEQEIVYAGQQAGITGFGITQENGGSGVKNWGLTPIRQVYSGSADVGGVGDPGICPGDSGGPAFVRYPDGSWHTFGIASTLTGQCGGVGTHSLAWNAVPWIEKESGIDITPCHDVDGTWNPSHRCTGFYAGEPGIGVGSWLQWCPETPRNPSSKTCGAAFDAEPDNTPPTVTIVTPTSGDHADEDVFTTAIEVDAADGDGWGVAVVRLKINGMEQPVVDDEPPYAFATVNFPKGNWELIAVAEDAAGLISESEPVLLNVGVEPPVETTGTPTSGDGETGAETGATPTTSGPETGDASDPSAVTLTTPGSASDTADTAPIEGGDDGCGCRSGDGPGGAAATLLLAFAGLCRRRRATAGVRA